MAQIIEIVYNSFHKLVRKIEREEKIRRKKKYFLL